MAKELDKSELEFFISTMPNSRPADYCLGYFEGSVYLDFDNFGDDLICLKRISFDRYGCCNLKDTVIPMDKDDSLAFKKIFEAQLDDQSGFTTIIKKTILSNKELIWEDALKDYCLL